MNSVDACALLCDLALNAQSPKESLPLLERAAKMLETEGGLSESNAETVSRYIGRSRLRLGANEDAQPLQELVIRAQNETADPVLMSKQLSKRSARASHVAKLRVVVEKWAAQNSSPESDSLANVLQHTRTRVGRRCNETMRNALDCFGGTADLLPSLLAGALAVVDVLSEFHALDREAADELSALDVLAVAPHRLVSSLLAAGDYSESYLEMVQRVAEALGVSIAQVGVVVCLAYCVP